MNKKDKRDIGINWAFVIFGSMLGFLINIVASSFFDLYVNGFRGRVLALLVGFMILSLFFVGLLSYAFDNMDEFKESGINKIIWAYLKSWRKK